MLTGTGGRSGAVDVALLLLWVFVGIAFVLHGWGKIRNVGGFSARHGVPIFLGAAAASVPCIGGLLVVRLLTPQAALGIGVTMVVAVVMLIRAGEAFINPGGHSWESAALYAVLMLCLMMLGAGRYSPDHVLFVRGPCQLLSVLLAGGTLLGRVALVDAEPPPAPPPIENVRYTEDYGYLRGGDPDATDALSPWGPVKYIPLNKAGDVYLTLGAELRLRYERYEDNNWGQGPQDHDGYLWARALPLADLHVGENVRFFGQFMSAFAYDLDLPVSPVDEDRLDVLQAFADVRLPWKLGDRAALTLRPGRQLLTYGSGRLIDIRYGPNVLQTFDAAKAFIETHGRRLDAFYARPVDPRPGEFDDRTDDRQSLWSLYGTLNPSGTPLGLDLYYIGYLNDAAVFAERTGRELRHTLGARLFGTASGWDWNFEFFYQFGEFDAGGADGAISAWSVASDTGYTFDDLPLRPRLALRADGGSESRYIGTQAELLLEYQVGRHRSVATSYSIFTAGPFIQETGADETIHLGAFELMYRF